MAKHLHERRKITFREYGALLATREMLARNELKFTPGKSCTTPGVHAFNMATKGHVNVCGSIGCIGGTMALLLGTDIYNYVYDHERTNNPDYVFGVEGRSACSQSLAELFYPPNEDAEVIWEWITPKVAVQAIDNWLKTGKPGWEKLKKAALKRK